MDAVLGMVVWAGLGLLPIYLASTREPHRVRFWWLAAILIGPLAGAAYLLARYGERRAARRNYEPRHAADEAPDTR